jgi:hypothetical protein
MVGLRARQATLRRPGPIHNDRSHADAAFPSHQALEVTLAPASMARPKPNFVQKVGLHGRRCVGAEPTPSTSLPRPDRLAAINRRPGERCNLCYDRKIASTHSADFHRRNKRKRRARFRPAALRLSRNRRLVDRATDLPQLLNPKLLSRSDSPQPASYFPAQNS